MMPCYYEGSLNDSGVTVNECTRHSALKSLSANNTDCMRFVSIVHDYRRRFNQSPFQPRAEVSFPHGHQFSEYNGKEASASRELQSKTFIIILYQYTKLPDTQESEFFGGMRYRFSKLPYIATII